MQPTVRTRGIAVTLVSVLFVFVLRAIPGAAQSGLKETIDGDPQAWKELTEAYGRLGQVKSVRIRKSARQNLLPSQSDLARGAHTWELAKNSQNAFDFHLIVGPADSRSRWEVILAGSQAVGRDHNSSIARGDTGWLCLGRTITDVTDRRAVAAWFLWLQFLNRYLPVLPPLADYVAGQFPPPSAVLERNIKITKLTDTVVEGEKTTVYEYSVSLVIDPRVRPASPNTPLIMTERLYVSANGSPRRNEILDSFGIVTIEIVDFQDYDAPITIVVPACR